MPKLILILLTLVVTIHVYNDTDYRLVYLLYHVDHDIQNYPYPANIAGGEIASNDIHKLNYHHPPGRYFIRWMACDSAETPDGFWREYGFTITDEDTQITLGHEGILRRPEI